MPNWIHNSAFNSAFRADDVWCLLQMYTCRLSMNLSQLCARTWLLKKSSLWPWQGQQPGLPGLQCSSHLACAASPFPLTLGGALHHHILVQTGVGDGWTSTEQHPQETVRLMPLLDFMQHFTSCENGFIIWLLGCEWYLALLSWANHCSSPI